ncbi:hypothetical protein EYF80_044314 [Liparis tanakae]|uniref:Uncharacterized protein n=1 Tax=Liparis tanakae TaxID=230148 RepID=A0A4Z2FW83_9TELE|nr:hypothetical protein EYF80_044314 [Liparis tanakae]
MKDGSASLCVTGEPPTISGDEGTEATAARRGGEHASAPLPVSRRCDTFRRREEEAQSWRNVLGREQRTSLEKRYGSDASHSKYPQSITPTTTEWN